MARPRIFISSTYYDLRYVRADLERYIRDRGFDPILSERGHIPYGSEKRLEEYCYKEIELCDILVAIIGGRYGSPSTSDDMYSVAQMELKTAIDLGRPVYVFVEKNVLAEYRTYEKNKGRKDINYVAVDDPRVYGFLEEVLALPVNNPVASFETAADITNYLQEQRAGLFQRLLQETARQKEVRLIEDMNAMISTLKQLVTFLTAEKTKGDQAIRDILLSNHPIFAQLKKLLKVPYRVFFTNLNEFKSWIQQRSFKEIPKENWDESGTMEWINSPNQGQATLLKISRQVFDDDGKLRIFTPDEWDSSLVQTAPYEEHPPQEHDDIPF